MRRMLLVDVGSTSVKWRESGPSGIGGVGKTPFPARLDLPEPFWEVKAEQIVRIVKDILRRSEAAFVLISTQMHGWLLGDGKGNILTNYISWQDRRAGLFPYPFVLPAEYGVGLKENLPRASVAATEKLCPELFSRAKEFFTLGSFLSWMLTGQNMTHLTDAAASGFFQVRTLEPVSCGLRLPKVAAELTAVGSYEGKTIFTPVGDQQASVCGAGGTAEDYILNLGTAGQMCAISPDFVSGDFEARPYFGGKTLCTVTGLPGGKVIRAEEDSPALEEELTRRYRDALAKLPKRTKMLVTGGTLKFYRPLVERTIAKCGVPLTFNEGADALDGLFQLGKEM